MKIKEIAFIGHPVTDVARARHFYEKILGLKAEMDEVFGGEGTDKKIVWIEYDVNGQALAISNAWEPTAHSGPTVALEVDDLDAWKKFLAEQQVPFGFDTMDTPGCRFFLIKDPDGNGIMLHQLKACRHG